MFWEYGMHPGNSFHSFNYYRLIHTLTGPNPTVFMHSAEYWGCGARRRMSPSRVSHSDAEVFTVPVIGGIWGSLILGERNLNYLGVSEKDMAADAFWATLKRAKGSYGSLGQGQRLESIWVAWCGHREQTPVGGAAVGGGGGKGYKQMRPG